MLSVQHEWWRKSTHPFCITGIPKIKYYPLAEYSTLDRWTAFYQEPVADAKERDIVFTIVSPYWKKKGFRYIVPRAATRQAAEQYALRWNLYFEKFSELFNYTSLVGRIVYFFDDGDMNTPRGCREFFPFHVHRQSELRYSQTDVFESPICEIKTLFAEGADYWFRTERDAVLGRLL